MDANGSRSGVCRTTVLLALVAVALFATGCSAQQRPRETEAHRAPQPVPPPTVVPTSTPTTLTTGSAVGTGTAHEPDLPAQVYQQVVFALKEAGFRMASEADLRMVYGRDKKTVTVTGRMRGPRDGSKGGEVGTVATVHLRLTGGRWQVTGTR